MAVAHVQTVFGSNGTSQTFTVSYGSTPSEGNLLVAALGHDEASVDDQADITSSGWTRIATFEDASDPGRRVSIWAKIAGASEPTAVNFDLGEVNRRAHAYVSEFSGFVLSLQGEDEGPGSGAWNSSTTSLQVASALNVFDDGVGIMMLFTMSTISDINDVTFDSGLTVYNRRNNNFRGSAVAWVENGGSKQPTVDWTGSANEDATTLFVVIGVQPPTSEVKAGSFFQVSEI